jgi:RNA polymerase sigma-70 factor (ECF subfamily)
METRSIAHSLDANRLWMSGTPADRERELAYLIERAITGDRAAFGEIVTRHERRVLTVAWRLLGTMEDAQDAAQEVFLRAFKYLHRFDTQKPLEAWLVGMTVNVCRSLGRKRSLQRSIFVHGSAFEPPDTTRDPHSQFSSTENRQILHRALKGLGEKERTAIVLRDLEGFSTAEVAEILGSSEATVRSQISVARLKIRKAIKEWGGER